MSEHFGKLSEKGYYPMMISDLVEDAKGNHYRSIVFVNPEIPKILIANAGTRLSFGVKSFFSDIKDNLRLARGKQPKKMEQIKAWNDQIITFINEVFPDREKELKIECVGHSLGAALASMQAVDLQVKLQSENKAPEVSKASQELSEQTVQEGAIHANRDKTQEIPIVESLDSQEKTSEISDKSDSPSNPKIPSAEARNFKITQRLFECPALKPKLYEGLTPNYADIIEQQNPIIINAKANVINNFGVPEMHETGVSKDMFEVFNLNKKSNPFTRFMKSTVGEITWGVVKAITKVAAEKLYKHSEKAQKFVKDLIKGIPVIGKWTATIVFAVTPLLWKLAKKIWNERTFSIIRHHVANLPSVIGDLESHKLGGLVQDDVVALRVLDISNIYKDQINTTSKDKKQNQNLRTFFEKKNIRFLEISEDCLEYAKTNNKVIV